MASTPGGMESKKIAADTECRRLESQHDVWKHAFANQLVFVPIDLTGGGPLRVLDSAGGNGYWLRDFMSVLDVEIRDDRGSLFVCADIDPLKFPIVEEQRGQGIQYLKHSFLNPWPEEYRDTFDLVHQRLVLAASGGVPFVDTMRRFKEILRPGRGWVQIVELDTSPSPSAGPQQQQNENGGEDGNAMEDFKYLLHTVSTATGVRPYFANGLGQDLREAGFVDVGEKRIEVPWGRAIVDDDGGGIVERSLESPGMPFFAETFREIAFRMGVEIDRERMDMLPERLERLLRERGGFVIAVFVWGRKALG